MKILQNVMFKPIRTIVETRVKLATFCILTCSLHFGLSFLSGPSLNVFSRCYAVCAVCMQAITHSIDIVPSQRAVKLVVVGLGFVE